MKTAEEITEQNYHDKVLPPLVFTQDYTVAGKVLFLKGDEYDSYNWGFTRLNQMVKKGILKVKSHSNKTKRMNLQEIKDQVAQENGFTDWNSVRNYEAIPTDDENDLIDEVVYRAIEEDRKDCAEGADLARFFPGDTEAVSISSILNRPLPELKLKSIKILFTYYNS